MLILNLLYKRLKVHFCLMMKALHIKVVFKKLVVFVFELLEAMDFQLSLCSIARLYRGEDCIQVFLEELKEAEVVILQSLKKRNKKHNLTPEEKQDYNNADTCWIVVNQVLTTLINKFV